MWKALALPRDFAINGSGEADGTCIRKAADVRETMLKNRHAVGHAGPAVQERPGVSLCVDGPQCTRLRRQHAWEQVAFPFSNPSIAGMMGRNRATNSNRIV